MPKTSASKSDAEKKVKKSPAKKAPAAKKPAARKPAAKKAAAPAKRAARKPAAKALASAKRPISAEEHYHMVQTAAYFRAQRDGFAGDAMSYWIEAEREIDAMLIKRG